MYLMSQSVLDVKTCPTSLKIGDEQLQAKLLPCSASAPQLIASDNGLQLALAHLSPELHVQQAAHRNSTAPARPGNARDATCNLVNNGAALATKTGPGATRGRAGGTPAVGGRGNAHHA